MQVQATFLSNLPHTSSRYVGPSILNVRGSHVLIVFLYCIDRVIEDSTHLVDFIPFMHFPFSIFFNTWCSFLML
jgi:hypothetical protein